jgi:hypothetical protein
MELKAPGSYELLNSLALAIALFQKTDIVLDIFVGGIFASGGMLINGLPSATAAESAMASATARSRNQLPRFAAFSADREFVQTLEPCSIELLI